MRGLQVRQTLGGNHGIEAFRFRAEIQCFVAVTIQAKDSRPLEGGTTTVAFELAVSTGVSNGQELRKRPLTYWIITLFSLMFSREA